MAKLGERVMVTVMAVLFLVTSLGFSGLVIWQMHDQSRKDNQTAEALKKVNEQTNDSTNKGAKLVGTKLQGFTPGGKIDGLKISDSKEGTGDAVKEHDTITANYTGALISDGTIFDTSIDRGQPATFSLDQVIEGWQKGLIGMKVGGKRRLLIPSSMAYKDQAQQSIPANSDLIFDVELISIGAKQ